MTCQSGPVPEAIAIESGNNDVPESRIVKLLLTMSVLPPPSDQNSKFLPPGPGTGMQIIRKRVRQTTEGDAYVRSAVVSLARYVEKGEVSGRHRNTSLAALTIKRIPWRSGHTKIIKARAPVAPIKEY